jgi:hypothetical protein
MPSSSLNLVELDVILERVQLEYLAGDPAHLQSNPILDAVQDVYDQLAAGVRRLAIEGQAVIQEARDAVVETWQRRSAELKEKAGEALSLFQKMVGDLIRELMEAIARAAPKTLNSPPAFEIKTIKFKMSLAVAPSVSLAAQEVFRLAVSAGTDVEYTYEVISGKETLPES